jgi:hypothetical protein
MKNNFSANFFHFCRGRPIISGSVLSEAPLRLLQHDVGITNQASF